MQTLLLVDDEPNIVEGLASQFEGRYGGDVIVLKSFSGLHALSILRNNKVDVVLSDIRMPDMDGLTLQRETEALWPHIHFVFLSGFDDFQFIHQASKSPLYHGYLLKMEGDEVVLNKIDQEIAQCAAEARAELEQGEMQRRYARMQGFLQRAALEGFVRGGGSWQQIQHSLPNLEMTLDPTRPVAMVLGKDTAAEATEHLQSLMQTTFFDAAEPPQLDSEQQLLLFTLLLNVRREIFAEQLGEEPARDTACFDLFNAYLRSGAATQLEMLHRFTDLCAETCRQREENETHSTQAIIKRINRYIEDNVENYDLSLTALARMTGFNPSYLSRFYRINTGKKLSDQIDEAKLQHAKKLIAQGELVKNVAERTGFASPSAFILFLKRNTGVTPRQYFESENKS